ncbi:hypothetical protein [Legionella sp. km772]|uniref:hypothetical protein n=1 Tax=Legionella sp. km772 TaxID=2498111 RepID=UPI000F8D0140|nr:hypothetical protein [Legionella sp. km772]RUR04025.1 hypothetical protein ELY15_15975 [Legionella sp. km772]
MDFSKTLLALLDNLASKGDVEAKKKLIADLEILAPTITNVKLKNLVDRGMINLGYGSLSSFLTQAQLTGFSFSTRDNIALQYQKLDEARGDVLTFDDEEDDELLKNKGIEDEDDFEILDIDDKHLASDILPSKDLEAQVKLAQSEQLAHVDELNEEARKKLEQENPNQATIKI